MALIQEWQYFNEFERPEGLPSRSFLLRYFGMKNFMKLIGLGMLGIIAASIYLTGICSQDWCTPFSVSKISQVTDFASCSTLGFPVSATFPRRCSAGLKEFLEDEQSPVRIWQPLAGSEAGLPLRIAGEARLASGARLQYRLQDRDGYVLDDRIIPLEQGASGAYIPFSVDVLYPRPIGTGGLLDIETLGPGKKERSLVSIPLTFSPVPSVEVKVYFGNSERDPQAVACDTAYPVARRIPRDGDALSFALRELLKGPSLSEQRQDFFTGIPVATLIRSASFLEGKVTVDFFGDFMREVGGSCRVTAMRAQVEQTIRQFPDVREVTITVEGSSEGVLEP